MVGPIEEAVEKAKRLGGEEDGADVAEQEEPDVREPEPAAAA